MTTQATRQPNRAESLNERRRTAQEMKALGIKRAKKNALKRIGPEAKALLAKALETNESVSKASKDLFPGDPQGRKEAVYALRNSPTAMEMLHDGLRIQIKPFIKLLEQANERAFEILSTKDLKCAKCKDPLDPDLKTLARMVQGLWSAVGKDGGPQKMIEESLRADLGVKKTMDDVVEEYFRQRKTVGGADGEAETLPG